MSPRCRPIAPVGTMSTRGISRRAGLRLSRSTLLLL